MSWWSKMESKRTERKKLEMDINLHLMRREDAERCGDEKRMREAESQLVLLMAKVKR